MVLSAENTELIRHSPAFEKQEWVILVTAAILKGFSWSSIEVQQVNNLT